MKYRLKTRALTLGKTFCSSKIYSIIERHFPGNLLFELGRSATLRLRGSSSKPSCISTLLHSRSLSSAQLPFAPQRHRAGQVLSGFSSPAA
jgi:hypothetical protein